MHRPDSCTYKFLNTRFLMPSHMHECIHIEFGTDVCRNEWSKIHAYFPAISCIKKENRISKRRRKLTAWRICRSRWLWWRTRWRCRSFRISPSQSKHNQMTTMFYIFFFFNFKTKFSIKKGITFERDNFIYTSPDCYNIQDNQKIQ